MKIGIAGVGGIGSNVAACLVRSGVKELKLVDFDRVEASNLNRQFYFQDQIGSYKVDMLARNLMRIDGGLALETLVLTLDSHNMAGTFEDCHMVVEGFDEQKSKKDFLEALAHTGKPMVSASGVAGSRLDTIHVRQLGHCTIVGDFSTDFRDARLYAPKISVIAAMMADVVLEKCGYYNQSAKHKGGNDE